MVTTSSTAEEWSKIHLQDSPPAVAMAAGEPKHEILVRALVYHR